MIIIFYGCLLIINQKFSKNKLFNNLYYKKTNQSSWDEFVDYIKNTEIPEDENISKKNIFITSDDKSLTIKVVEKDKTYQTRVFVPKNTAFTKIVISKSVWHFFCVKLSKILVFTVRISIIIVYFNINEV